MKGSFSLISLSNLLDKEYRRGLRALLQDYVISVHSCYYWHCARPWDVPWRKRIYGFFLIPSRGSLRVSIGQRCFTLKPGEFAIVPENTRHAYKIAKDSVQTDHFIIHC